MTGKALFATVILTFCAGMLAAETGALFAVAEEYNQEYRRLQLDRELTALRLERQRIQARDKLDELHVGDAALAMDQTYRRGLEAFYHDILDATFGVAAAQLRRDIAELHTARAREQLRQVELRFDRGLAPRTDVLQARVALRAARRDGESAGWALDDSLITFRDALGRDWDASLLPRVTGLPDTPGPPADYREAWMDAHPGLARARKALEIARYRRANLPGNAPAFDRRIAEAEVERAEFEVTRARTAAEGEYEQITRSRRTQGETILIRREEIELQEDLSRESRLSFERGMATALERDQAAIQLLQARLQLLTAELEYLKRDVARSLALTGAPPGTPPEGSER